MGVMNGLEIYNSLGIKTLTDKTIVSKIVAKIQVNGRKEGEEVIDTMGAKKIITFVKPLLFYGQNFNINVVGNKVIWKSDDIDVLTFEDPRHFLGYDNSFWSMTYGKIIIPTIKNKAEMLPKEIICVGY